MEAKSIIKKYLGHAIVLFFSVLMTCGAVSAASYPTVYKGVDYKKVYNYNYYIKMYPAIAKSCKYDKQKILKYYVENQVNKGILVHANKDFYAGNYYLRYRYLRKKFGMNYKALTLFYINDKGKYPNATYTDKMLQYNTVFCGKDYKSVYDFNYIKKKYPEVFKKIGWNEDNMLEYFVTVMAPKGQVAKAGVSAKKTKEVTQKYKKWKKYPYAYQTLSSIGRDLRKAFNYSARMKYFGHNTWAQKHQYDSMDYFATYGFRYYKGPCQTMAASFYQMAHELGYKARIRKGGVYVGTKIYWGSFKHNGQWYNIHYWTEIYQNGRWYVYDPNYTNETNRNGFKTTYSNMGWRYLVQDIVMKNY